MIDYFDDFASKPRLSVRMEDNETETIYKMALPGLSADEIELTVKGERILLKVKADMGFVAIHDYSFVLNPASQYDFKATDVKLKDGLLELFIPKVKSAGEEIKLNLS